MLNRKNSITNATVFVIIGLAGPFVVLPFIIFLKWDVWSTLAKSFIVAITNGIVCYAIGTFLYKIFNLKILWHLIIELVITVIITSAGAVLTGCTDLAAIILMIICAGIICVVISLFMHRYKTRLDQKLSLAQERLLQQKPK
jgi:hypothetical protein